MSGAAKGHETGRLVAVDLDEASLGHSRAYVEYERATAIYDLLAENSFRPVGRPGGEFRLHLSVVENKLVFDVVDAEGARVVSHILSLTPLRRVIKDYFLVCDSYYAALRTANPAQIEAIDMGRRGIHNEGSEILKERLAGKIELDFETARRLFTLVSALGWKG